MCVHNFTGQIITGNSPLHLAAFNGHAEVTRVLINQGPSRANVNEQVNE